jgi:hypothetical protein
MMQDKAIRTVGKVSIGIIVGMIAACAGSDTPPRTDEFDQDLASVYPPGSATGSAATGGTASGGTGGRASTGNGGTASGRGGSGTGGSASPGTGGSATAGAAGAGSSAAGSAGTGSGACDGFTILKTSCGSSGCHGAGSGYSAFAATEADAADFVGTDGEGPLCGGEGPIFDPANPPASLVMLKIAGTACGGKMPLGSTTPFPPADVTCIEDWISTLE